MTCNTCANYTFKMNMAISVAEADWLDNEVDLQDLLPDFGSFSELACDSLDASDMFTALTPLEPGLAAIDVLHSAVKESDLLKYDDTERLPDVDLLFRGLPNLDVDTGTVDIEPVLSPVSIEDVECLLSSGPLSPSGSLSADSDSSFSVASSDVSDVRSDGCGSVGRQRDREVGCPYKNKSGRRETKILDKKLRKKQQNKDAALRYRLKKKAESITMEEDLQGLEGRNKELKDSVEQMTREIQYLKDLMAEVYKAELSKSSRNIVS